ncbi:MAG: DUF928 domain-containing protein [Spirulina sp.]
MNRLHWRTWFALCLFLQILSGGSFARVEAEAQTRRNPVEERLIFNEAFEPTEGELPKTRGAGSRNKCGSEAIAILMPDRGYGLTFEERPSLFIKLPETPARSVWLSFYDQNGEFFANAEFPLPQTSGIVRFALPDRFPPLETGHTYKWQLAVVCGETLAFDDPLFTGYVTRITRTPEIEGELAPKNAIERARWYAKEGYWYDLLLTMARAKQESPDDANLAMLWESLLTSVGLGDIASQPIYAID